MQLSTLSLFPFSVPKFLHIKASREGESRCYFTLNQGFNRSNKLSRYIVTRSQLGGTGILDATNSLSEIKPSPKFRGVCFYGMTVMAGVLPFGILIVAHPLALIFDPYRTKFYNLIPKLWATASIAPFFDIELEGLENLPPQNAPAVYVSNHQSIIDFYPLLTLGRSFKFIGKNTVFFYPGIGWAMYILGMIPVKRMDIRSHLEAVRRCMDLVRNGASVFFFPEGTRSKDGKLGDFKKGAFTVAAKTGVPVIPMTLIGTGEIMPAGMEHVVNSGSVKLIIHKPIKGNDPEILRLLARNTILDTLSIEAQKKNGSHKLKTIYHLKNYPSSVIWTKTIPFFY
ncbi:1-acyl-sn-glycerol-3-phosphate acyltransferase BAT2, chloroplastic-like isoform X2 [Gossypium arboreum]|uniref:1-acyl-sn-glycerol-3-phosphate acyltransferase BAT2, chloroplastic-like isoform X2 n=1 Tax=Gossypium arboreum TaxID=29729 RepID=UPI0022F18AD7|nr:1-acyl-sn-glycerol-3-phosphate acyltransferase BAT2, chloroplastic-like isoform X2 [Gossypium arboreum]